MYIHSQNRNTIVISGNLTNIYIKYSNYIIGADKKYDMSEVPVNMVEISKKPSERNYYYIYCTTTSGEDVKLGQYYSRERCQKILSEILDFYLHVEEPFIYTMPKE